jgi:hypothetical protein
MSTGEGHGKHIPALDSIAEQLREYIQFICWREVERGGRLTKEPVNPRNGQLADVSDAKTWADAETALERAVALDCDGIGFVFTRNDPFTCVDLDHCLDPDTGELTPQAAEIVSLLDSYTETSPSGTGLHIIVRATPETERQRTKGFELYAWDHYVTLTGRLVGRAKPRIYERQKELRSLSAQLFGTGRDVAAAQPTPTTGGLTDEEVIAKANAAANGEWFSDLHEGRWKERGYESQSEADYAYMGSLRFWTAGNEEQMVRIFRTSGLMRDKAKRDDYLVGMARKLIDAGGDTYGNALTVPPVVVQGQGRGGAPEPLADVAFYGPIGAAVRVIAPHCEGDPAGLLINSLAAFGSLVGTKPHMLVGRDRHTARLFAVFVGTTSKARKGLTWNFVKDLYAGIDQTFPKRVTEGLSSGEGLIFAVRDRIVKIKEDGEEEVVDEGVEDKRLLVVEGEFGSVLRVAKRTGSILSAVMREAWDSGNLNTLTKNNPTRATGAHISVLGHITREELIRELDSTDIANGFANRILFVHTKRSKLLPFGGELSQSALSEVRDALNTALVFAQGIDEMGWGSQTRDLWAEHYPRLAQGYPGLFGYLTARSEAQVLRLAIVYALADSSLEITPEHLLAALEVWRYVSESTRLIFGLKTGDPLADRIREGLRTSPAGLSRTEIRNLFNRHESESRIEAALEVLAGLGFVKKEVVSTAGRPREVWRATEATEATEES